MNLLISLILSLFMVSAPQTVVASNTCAAAGQTASYSPGAKISYLDGYRNGGLVFKRDGRTVAIITGHGELIVEGIRIDLDFNQQFVVMAYFETYKVLTDQSKAVGEAGARLGTQATFRLLRSLFTPGMTTAQLTRDFEDEASDLETKAGIICLILGELESRHATLSELMPEFGRVVRLEG